MKKNLIVILVDQWRNKTIGYNNPQVITPNFDAFYQDSVSFQNAVTVCPLCSPCRAALFTGKYPVQNGVYGNCMTGYNIALQEEEECLTDVLARNGYATAYIGKWHLDEPELNHCDAPESGASGWDAYTPPGPRRHHIDYWHAYNAWNEHMHQHYWEDTPRKIQAEEWSPIHETDRALQFIERSAGSPFALFLAWNPPHTPFDQVPQKYLDLYQGRTLRMENVETDKYTNHTGEQGFAGRELMQEKTRQYYACVSGLDEQFGRLTAYLRKKSLYDDTLILLTADHGEHLGSHGLVGKHTWYEESVNVPMLLRFPPKLIPHRNESCISTVQLMPTLLSLLDIRPPEWQESRDIAADLAACQTVTENYSFIAGYVSRDIFIEAFRAIGVLPVDVGWRAVRDDRWTYVIVRGYMPGEESQILLYDRLQDPEQKKPLNLKAAVWTSRAVDLHELLMEHLRQENPGFARWAEQELQGVLPC